VKGLPGVELRVVEGGNSSHDSVPELPIEPAPSDATVHAWIERARRDDPKAWDHLYRRHYDDVHRHVLYLQGDSAIAEDLVQETFVRAMRGIGGYRGQASFATWLHRIAINVVRRHWRRTSTRRRTVEGFARATGQRRVPSPEDVHAEAIRARALLSALEQLAPKLREAFVLRDLMGLPSSEAAELLEISPGHLAVRSHRARAKLREVLTARGWNDGT
jgi:RNA polymerase sigma-70 factor (ECF subfamily)